MTEFWFGPVVNLGDVYGDIRFEMTSRQLEM